MSVKINREQGSAAVEGSAGLGESHSQEGKRFVSTPPVSDTITHQGEEDVPDTVCLDWKRSLDAVIGGASSFVRAFFSRAEERSSEEVKKKD